MNSKTHKNYLHTPNFSYRSVCNCEMKLNYQHSEPGSGQPSIFGLIFDLYIVRKMQ